LSAQAQQGFKALTFYRINLLNKDRVLKLYYNSDLNM